MKKLRKLLDKRWFANLFVLVAGIVIYLALSHISGIGVFISGFFGVVSPIIIGILVAFIVEPIVKFLETKIFRKIKKDNVKRGIAVTLAVLFVLILIILFFSVLVPSLVSSISTIISNISTYRNNLIDFIDGIKETWIGHIIDLNNFTRYMKDITTNVTKYITDNASTILSTSIDIGSAVFNVVVGFIIGVYFLMGKKRLMKKLDAFRKAAMKPEKIEKHNRFFEKCNRILVQYIGYNLLDGLIVGTVNWIAMTIIGLPFAPLISVVIGVTNLIPTFGPIIGAIMGSILLLMNEPINVLWFLIITVVIQIVDAYILKPRLYSGSLGVSAVLTLISIIIGGKLFGVLGMFFAVPVTAIISLIYNETFLPWLKARNNSVVAETEDTENKGE